MAIFGIGIQVNDYNIVSSKRVNWMMSFVNCFFGKCAERLTEFEFKNKNMFQVTLFDLKLTESVRKINPQLRSRPRIDFSKFLEGWTSG